MARTTKGSTDTSTVDILKVNVSEVAFHILGTSPLICNAMSAKARQDLLFPPPKKSRTQRDASLKHDPMAEYRRSPYKAKEADAPTRIIFPGGGFKGAMARAALDIDGANKSMIGRNTYVTEYNIPIFGIPQMLMSVVRSADMNRTPDVRTRAIIPEWAAIMTVRFVTPLLREQSVTNLVASAGITIGIGDWRPERGKGAFGQFEVVSPTDKRFQRILKTGGREAQDRALEEPTYFDSETEELYGWFVGEVQKRGFKTAA